MIFRRMRPALLLCLLLILFSGGCVEKKHLPPVAHPWEEATVEQLLQQAETAWQAQDYERSKQLYDILVSESLDRRQLAQAWERLALSSLQTGDPARAQDALIRAALHDPTLRQRWFWHEYRIIALMAMDRDDEAREYLLQMLQQSESPWTLRSSAGIRLSEIYRDQKDYAALRSLFARLSAMAPDDQARGELERILTWITRDISDAHLQRLVELVPPGDRVQFPDTVFVWEQHRREARANPESWPEVRMYLHRLLQEGDWAEPERFSEDLAQLGEHLGIPGICVGLAVPLDGPLADTGWKIVRGAEAARKILLEQGLALRMEIVNSQALDMLETFAAMDPECTIIGGPLQRDVWDQIHAAGLAEHRRFFTFLPTMSGAEEGQEAWRFFGSPRDQVQALAGLAMDDLNIQSLAVLFPQDRFGEHMGEIFTREVASLGGRIDGYQSYPPADHAGWGEAVASLLGVPAQQRRGREKVAAMPNPAFQAVFIPDSLRNAEMLIPQFFYYDEQRLLILGPELWSQSWLQRAESMEQQYFRLAVIPGAWWPDNPSPAARNLRDFFTESGHPADFWIALGYDFVRMTSRLGAGSRPLPAQDLNDLLTGLVDFEWSMAPLSWDDLGQVHQNVFLFQPTSQGLSIIDPTALRNQLDRTRMRFSR